MVLSGILFGRESPNEENGADDAVFECVLLTRLIRSFWVPHGLLANGTHWYWITDALVAMLGVELWCRFRERILQDICLGSMAANARYCTQLIRLPSNHASFQRMRRAFSRSLCRKPSSHFNAFNVACILRLRQSDDDDASLLVSYLNRLIGQFGQGSFFCNLIEDSHSSNFELTFAIKSSSNPLLFLSP